MTKCSVSSLLPARGLAFAMMGYMNEEVNMVYVLLELIVGITIEVVFVINTCTKRYGRIVTVEASGGC